MLDHIAKVGKQYPMKIHLDVGDNELGVFERHIFTRTQEVYDALLSAGFSASEVRNQVIKDGSHDEPSWRSRAADILTWLNRR